MLRKQERKRKAVSKASKELAMSTSTSTNTSNVSVNKDWEHWTILQNKKENVGEDVREIGKTLGVIFKGEQNLLTKEGRRVWRAERGSLLEEGKELVSGSVNDGV